MRQFLALITVLIIYGSLYPFKFSGQAPGLSETLGWLTNLSLQTTRSDIIANILLFMPYGFVARLCVNNHKHRLRSSLWLLLAGSFVAFLTQYLQFFLPARVPSAADALLNMAGIITGMVLSHLILQYSHNHIPRSRTRQVSWSQVSLPLILAILWVAWRWFPFIPIVATESLMSSFNPLINRPHLDLELIIRDGIGWLLFYYLLSQRPFDKQPRFRVLKIAFYIIGIELFIANNELTVNDLLAALGAFALYASMHFEAQQRLLIWAVAIAIVLTWLAPLQLTTTNHQISWMPFASLLKGNPWQNANLLLLKLFLLGSLIFLLRNQWLDWGPTTLASIIFIIVISLLQLWIGNKAPDITDILLVGLIGWSMYQVDKLASDERKLAMHG